MELQPPSSGRGVLRQRCARDVDEHAHNLSGWQQRYDQLGRGAFVGELTEHAGAALQVFRERTSQALRQRCTIRNDAVWCGITVRHDGSRIEGREVGAHGLLVCGEAREFELVTPAGHDIVGVVASRGALAWAAERAGLRLPWADLGAPQWLARRPERQAALRAVLLSALDPAAADADPAPHVLHALAATLAEPEAATVGARAQPSAARRRAVVRQISALCEAQLADDPTQPLPSVAELCARFHLSRRSLQYAFEDTLGIGPLALLRSLRLNQARRLLTGRDGVATVQQAALAAGFYDLSQFTRDYRAQFGETPSQALRRRATAGEPR